MPSIEARLKAAGLPALPRLAWLEIDTDALASNLRAVRTLAPPRAQVAAVVKSDGYGHGLEVAARTFLEAGAELLCVATLDEGLRLRAAGIAAPLLALFEVPPEAIPVARAHDLELVVSDPAGLERTLAAMAAATAPAGRAALRVHLEIETGLGRAGFPPPDAGRAAQRIVATPGVHLAGLWTHFASSHDAAATAEQLRRFGEAQAALVAAGVPVPLRHVAATGGLFRAELGDGELVRPGLALYGELPDGFPIVARAAPVARQLRPAMTLKARPLRVERLAEGEAVGYGGLWRAPRPATVATLPLGYGDGWSRAYGGRASALVRGRRVPLVGSVAMDAVMADVSALPDVTTADEFVLLGAQGDERITATELARLRTTISWEVLASMAYRIARVYHAAAGLTGTRTLAGEQRTR
jgi:alanine racemase